MSTGARFLDVADRVSDRLNPILVKETRQSLKSRQFVVTFMLLLLAAWLISAGGVLISGSALEYGAAGQGFFGMYFSVLVFAILVIVPFGAFRSMLAERDQFTFELLSISTLTPRQIVWGKLCSSIVQILLFYSAIAPFIAFTSLLQGFDLANVVFLLTIAFFWSVFVSMIALTLSTISHNRNFQSLSSVGVVILLIWQIGMAIGISGQIMMDSIPFDDPDFWWGMSCTAFGGGTYFLLAQQIAVSRLTFESDNRSTGIRVICGLQFWLLWLGCVGYVTWYGWGGNEWVFLMASTLSVLHWCAVGLFAVTEEDYLSRRIRRRVPRTALLRFLYSFWMPGGGRGTAWVMLHLACVAVFAWYLADSASSSVDRNEIYALLFAVGYSVIYLNVPAALARWGRALSPDFRAAHARVLTVILFALAMVAPYIPFALELVRPTFGYSVMYVSNPFEVISSTQQMSSADRELTAWIVATCATLSIVINLKSMLLEVIEVVRLQPVRRTGIPAVAAALDGVSAFEAHEPPPSLEVPVVDDDERDEAKDDSSRDED